MTITVGEFIQNFLESEKSYNVQINLNRQEKGSDRIAHLPQGQEIKISPGTKEEIAKEINDELTKLFGNLVHKRDKKHHNANRWHTFLIENIPLAVDSPKIPKDTFVTIVIEVSQK